MHALRSDLKAAVSRLRAAPDAAAVLGAFEVPRAVRHESGPAQSVESLRGHAYDYVAALCCANGIPSIEVGLPRAYWWDA